MNNLFKTYFVKMAVLGALFFLLQSSANARPYYLRVEVYKYNWIPLEGAEVSCRLDNGSQTLYTSGTSISNGIVYCIFDYVEGSTAPIADAWLTPGTNYGGGEVRYSADFLNGVSYSGSSIRFFNVTNLLSTDSRIYARRFSPMTPYPIVHIEGFDPEDKIKSGPDIRGAIRDMNYQDMLEATELPGGLNVLTHVINNNYTFWLLMNGLNSGDSYRGTQQNNYTDGLIYQTMAVAKKISDLHKGQFGNQYRGLIVGGFSGGGLAARTGLIYWCNGYWADASNYGDAIDLPTGCFDVAGWYAGDAPLEGASMPASMQKFLYDPEFIEGQTELVDMRNAMFETDYAAECLRYSVPWFHWPWYTCDLGCNFDNNVSCSSFNWDLGKCALYTDVHTNFMNWARGGNSQDKPLRNGDTNEPVPGIAWSHGAFDPNHLEGGYKTDYSANYLKAKTDFKSFLVRDRYLYLHTNSPGGYHEHVNGSFFHQFLMMENNIGADGSKDVEIPWGSAFSFILPLPTLIFNALGIEANYKSYMYFYEERLPTYIPSTSALASKTIGLEYWHDYWFQDKNCAHIPAEPLIVNAGGEIVNVDVVDPDDDGGFGQTEIQMLFGFVHEQLKGQGSNSPICNGVKDVGKVAFCRSPLVDNTCNCQDDDGDECVDGTMTNGFCVPIQGCSPDEACPVLDNSECGSCDDGNVCTIDICISGSCSYTNNSNSCDDGIYCNGSDSCSGGTCSNHTGNPCDDGIACTVDSCIGISGASNSWCQFEPVHTNCNDNNPCTVDVCDADSGCQHTRTTACCTPIFGSRGFVFTAENYSWKDDYSSSCADDGGRDVCYSWTPTTSGTYVLNTCSGLEDFDTILAIRDDSGETELVCNDDYCGSDGLQSWLTFDAVAGTTYTIVVDAFSQNAQGYFDLNISCPVIPSSGTISGSTTAETDDYSSSCADDLGRDVCYLWQPTVSGTYVFDTCDSGTNFDTVLSVFGKYGFVNDLACNDDYNGDPCSRLVFNAQAFTTYRLVVDGYDGNAHGDFVLNITEPECPVIPDSGTITGSTLEETDNFPSSCGDGESLVPDVCYLWTPTLSGTYVIDTCASGTTFDTVLTVLSEDGNTEFTCVNEGCGSTRSLVEFDALAGTTYRIVVDGYDSNAHGGFVLNITEPECQVIPATGTFSGSTTTEPDNFGSSCADDGGRDVCYLWTPTVTWTYEISTCYGGTNFDSVVTVFSEDDRISDLACSDNHNGDPCSLLNFNAEAGVTYRIVVDGYDGSAHGDYDLSITDVGGPACGDGSCNGDETCFSCEHDCGPCCTEITSGSSVSGSTTAATDDYSSSCADDGGRDVCYSWTPTVSGIYELDTCGDGTDFDTVLSIRAATLSSPEITCNDDDRVSCTNLRSKISFNAVAGNQYWIVVDGFQAGEYGNFVLNLSDVLCTAIDASGTVIGDNISETDDYQSCNWDSGGRDICYAWTPRVSGPYMLDTCNGSTDFDTTLSVRDFGGTSELACDDDFCEDYRARLTFEAVAYKTYRIVVDGYSHLDFGNFALDIIQGGCSSAADCNDFDACTTDSCDSGICSNTSIAHTCNDGNPCTEDFCDWFFGCLGNPVMDGTPCSDGITCNGQETCQAGVCTEGSMPDCDDDNECTDDYCDTFSGCMNVAVADDTLCGDNNVCNGTDSCQAGLCTMIYAPPNCDDGVECTLDSCDALLGCQNTPTADCCTPISGAVSVAGTILSESNGGVDYYVSCNINRGGADLCYSWTATVSGSHVFDTCDTADLDTILSIRNQEGNVELVCDDDSCGTEGLQSRVAFNAEAGVTYTIVVDAYDDFGE
jgi:hypothetical protein